MARSKKSKLKGKPPPTEVGGEQLSRRRRRRRDLRMAAAAVRAAVAEETGAGLPLPTVRSHTITEAEVDEIIERVAGGETASQCMRDLDLTFTQFYDFLEVDPVREQKYARARKLQAEAWSDKIVHLAARPVKYDGEPGAASAEIQHRNLEVGVRKWLMGKRNAGYADKATVVHEGNPTAPVATEDVSDLTPEQRAERYQQTLRQMKAGGG